MKQIKIKGKRVYKKTMVDNIIEAFVGSTYHEKSVGFQWYQDANNLADTLSRESGYSIFKTAGVIAALSPLTSWDRNKEIARKFLVNRERKGLHTTKMIGKAEKILEADNFTQVLKILNGDKIRNFAENILHPFRAWAVTIDRHAISVAYGREISDKERPQLTNKQYEFIADAYRSASKTLSQNTQVAIAPHELQAVTWVNFRIKKQTID